MYHTVYGGIESSWNITGPAPATIQQAVTGSSDVLSVFSFKVALSCLLVPAPFSAAACVRLPLCRLPSAAARRGCSLLTAHRHLHGWAVWSVTYCSARPASAFSAPAACIPGTRTSHTRAARARISMVDKESFSGTCSVAQAGARRSLYARQIPSLCAAPPARHASLVCQRSNAFAGEEYPLVGISSMLLSC